MIPEDFHSFETDAPFEKCVRCESAVLDSGVPYIINKQFSKGECVLEFAMCQPCHGAMQREMSPESRAALEEFFDYDRRIPVRSAALEGEEYDRWITHCVICSTPAEETEGHSLATIALGSEQMVDPYPMLVCSGCQARAESKLSPTSRKNRDKFITDHFPGPPTDLEPLPSRTKPALF